MLAFSSWIRTTAGTKDASHADLNGGIGAARPARRSIYTSNLCQKPSSQFRMCDSVTEAITSADWGPSSCEAAGNAITSLAYGACWNRANDKITLMENANPMGGMRELLAEMFETLKRHERLLVDLTLDVAGLKATLTGDSLELFHRVREKARSGSSVEFDRHFHLYDETIQRLRDK